MLVGADRPSTTFSTFKEESRSLGRFESGIGLKGSPLLPAPVTVEITSEDVMLSVTPGTTRVCHAPAAAAIAAATIIAPAMANTALRTAQIIAFLAIMH